MQTQQTPSRREFEAWRQSADAICSARHGLALDDLADCPYYDWYEDGVSPADAVRRALRNERSGALDD